MRRNNNKIFLVVLIIVDKMAEAYKMEADKIKEMMGEEEKNSIMKDLAVTKAAEFIVANIA